MIIEAAVNIQAPPETAWQVFVTIEEWGRWNTACHECRLIVGRGLEEGACLSFVVKPFIFPVRVSPRVVACEPGREVVWAGGRWGIRAVHRWRFLAQPGGVRLESTETFGGALLPVGRMLGLEKRLHGLTLHMLDQIRCRAEACARGSVSG